MIDASLDGHPLQSIDLTVTVYSAPCLCATYTLTFPSILDRSAGGLSEPSQPSSSSLSHSTHLAAFVLTHQCTSATGWRSHELLSEDGSRHIFTSSAIVTLTNGVSAVQHNAKISTDLLLQGSANRGKLRDEKTTHSNSEADTTRILFVLYGCTAFPLLTATLFAQCGEPTHSKGLPMTVQCSTPLSLGKTVVLTLDDRLVGRGNKTLLEPHHSLVTHSFDFCVRQSLSMRLVDRTEGFNLWTGLSGSWWVRVALPSVLVAALAVLLLRFASLNM